MKEFLKERHKQENISRIIGTAMSVIIPASAAVFCSFTGFSYIWPPPQETSFLLDFTEDIEDPIQHRDGAQPQSEEIDLTKPIELVQKSQSPYESKAQNLTPSVKDDDHGDVETPAVQQKPELDPRASFPGMAKKDTSLTAPHGASESSPSFKAGQSMGNTDKGQTAGAPNAHLQGRNVIGTLPKPAYSVQNSGIVVVTIWVDNYGNVTKAQAGADGTTVTDQHLWAAARTAAMKAHFNQKPDAPALQQGTITYIFDLK